MFDPSSALDVALDVRRISKNIVRLSKQADRLALEQQTTLQGMPFKAVPGSPMDLAFRVEAQSNK